jgi:hypothetical protein
MTTNANVKTDLSFSSWLWILGRKAALITLIGPVLSLVLSILGLIPPLPSGWRASLPIAIPVFQAAVIAILLFFIPPPCQHQQKHPESTVALTQFYHVWIALWVSWLLLYLVLTVIEIGPFKGPLRPWESLITNFFNNIPSVIFLLAYFILSERTVLPGGTTTPLPWLQLLAVLVIMTGGELVSSVFEFAKTGGSTDQTAMIFRWISGLAAAVAISLFVGRLESKTIDPPRILIVLFYFYAAIQVAWAAFPSGGRLVLVILSFALVLKCLLFLFVAWLLQSCVLLYYMSRQRRILESGTEERRKFLTGLAEP